MEAKPATTPNQPLLDLLEPNGWDREAAALQAEAMYSNKGLRNAARAFATVHPYAIQYLQQAPVMIVMTGVDSMPGKLHTYFQFKILKLCQDGASLKDMMAAFGFPLQLRKLRANALFPSCVGAVSALAEVDPVVLGRLIPDKKQPTWMKRVADWVQRHRFLEGRCRHPRWAGPEPITLDSRLVWAAENCLSAPNGPARFVTDTRPRLLDVADYVLNGDRTFNPKWKWNRTAEECELWHDRLAQDKGMKSAKYGPSTRIDKGEHPDAVEVQGFTFTALRRPLDIAAEGAAMRHCVASYIPSVANGQCHIISVSKAGKRVATLELSSAYMGLQFKAARNAEPPPEAILAKNEYVRKTLAPLKKARGQMHIAGQVLDLHDLDIRFDMDPRHIRGG